MADTLKHEANLPSVQMGSTVQFVTVFLVSCFNFSFSVFDYKC